MAFRVPPPKRFFWKASPFCPKNPDPQTQSGLGTGPFSPCVSVEKVRPLPWRARTRILRVTSMTLLLHCCHSMRQLKRPCRLVRSATSRVCFFSCALDLGRSRRVSCGLNPRTDNSFYIGTSCLSCLGVPKHSDSNGSGMAWSLGPSTLPMWATAPRLRDPVSTLVLLS